MLAPHACRGLNGHTNLRTERRQRSIVQSQKLNGGLLFKIYSLVFLETHTKRNHEQIGQIHNAGQRTETRGGFGIVVIPDSFGQLRREIPFASEQRADMRMGESEREEL